MDDNIMEFLELIQQNGKINEIIELEREIEELNERLEKNTEEFYSLMENKLT